MALGIAELIIVSLIVDWCFRRIKIPGLVGMLLVGVVLGPYVLDKIPPDLLAISGDLPMIALIVILLRAGLELSRETLHRVGVRVLLLACVPPVIEGVAVALVAPPLLGLSAMEGAVLGAVLGAVSPAVVVPLMFRFIQRRMGAKKGIPTLILAASSIDVVFVVVVYTVLIGIYMGDSVNVVREIASIPVSIVMSCAAGLGMGLLVFHFFRRFNPRATKRVLVLLSISILLLHAEDYLREQYGLHFATLLAVLAIGFIILEKDEHMAHEISARLGKVWVFAEIVLFTMVGSQVDVGVALQSGLAGAAVIFTGLAARSAGTCLCLVGSELTWPERSFVAVSYLPKATVQAAIGGGVFVALSAAGRDTTPGAIILAVAVLSIVVTAPLGAWATAALGERVLEVAPETQNAAADAARESDGGHEFMDAD